MDAVLLPLCRLSDANMPCMSRSDRRLIFIGVRLSVLLCLYYRRGDYTGWVKSRLRLLRSSTKLASKASFCQILV